MPSIPVTADVYDSRTIALHWITVGLVLPMWIIGQCIDVFPKGAPRMNARSIHITIGALLAVLLIVRIAWRQWGGVKLSRGDSGVLGQVAKFGHYLLYALLIAVIVMGITCVWVRGDTLFNLFTVPAFDPNNRRLPDQAVDLHGFAANALLAVAGVHAVAAVLHHRVLRDGVLRRMWPSRSQAESGKRE